MPRESNNTVLGVINGSARGPGAAAMRAALGAVEPFYAGATQLRNRLFDAGFLRIAKLPRPVVSVGNITTGGTGKTPMVRWLAAALRQRGRNVAVLSRGYKSAPGQLGDEQIMLDRLLNGPAMPPVALKANPSRVIAAQAALQEHPETDVFLLDDGFQHRRVARDLDIVLISAADPFGGGRVLPRGLLREPIGGLRRADAFVITHADAVAAQELAKIEGRIRASQPDAPIHRAVHAPAGLRTAKASAALAPDRTMADLCARRFFAFAGVGNPAALDRQLQAVGGAYAGGRWFADHHAYGAGDLADVQARAAMQNANLLLTTEKDWVKVEPLAQAMPATMEIWRLDVELHWLDNGDARLLDQVLAAIRN